MTRTQHTSPSTAHRRGRRRSQAGLALALCAALGTGSVLGVGVTPSQTGIGGPGTVYVAPDFTGLGGPGTMSSQPLNSAGSVLASVTPDLTGLGGPGTM